DRPRPVPADPHQGLGQVSGLVSPDVPGPDCAAFRARRLAADAAARAAYCSPMRFHHRAVPIVLCILLLDAIGFGIVLPVLPSLIVHLAHVTVSQATRIAGYMLVAYAVMQFLAGPIMGNLGDRFGRRPVLLACTLAFTVDYGLMAAAPA